MLETPYIIEGYVCLRGNMGRLYFHRMPRYPEHVEDMCNQAVHDLPMNHDYCKHVAIACVNALMPLLDASLEHTEDEDLEIFHEAGPKPKRRVVPLPCRRAP